MTVPKSHWQGIPDEGSTGARASPQTVENMNNNGEKQEMQVLLDFTLFLVLLLFCLLLALCTHLQRL